MAAHIVNRTLAPIVGCPFGSMGGWRLGSMNVMAVLGETEIFPDRRDATQVAKMSKATGVRPRDRAPGKFLKPTTRWTVGCHIALSWDGGETIHLKLAMS
jgi:hypothetical protein